jgi:hypothetical protein
MLKVQAYLPRTSFMIYGVGVGNGVPVGVPDPTGVGEPDGIGEGEGIAVLVGVGDTRIAVK